ncbi:P-loop containing nucleoside triphosphate hydrolase protein [Tribonema minus]|uniref:DNA 3'-5' helicase n=1 Tax=Tribonema minus TaxID=303371 RepID=A0A835Z0I6_9STRA|nr:P-loop containing nucleoside triphosphate hydrolase protein [Tribonema minus]
MALKRDHEKRPLWVCPDGHIFLEAHTPLYTQAYDFLVAIAEPVARPEFVHEYRLTPFSLYAAVAVAIDTESIIRVLNRLSKVEVPEGVNTFIRDHTQRCGKAKLVLKRGRYYVESPHPDVLRALLKDREIETARIKGDDEEEGEAGGEFIQSEAAQEMDANLEFKQLAAEAEGGGDDDDQVMHFKVSSEQVEAVKRAALSMDYPLMEEYDFRHDVTNPNLPMQLKPNTKIRQYQEKSLRKMFGNGRARSGIIVLPCGAGKTLTGVTAASTVKKSTLVLCTSGVSVIQWKYQFQLWTDIPEKNIACFTSDTKDAINPDACVLITTYSMLSFSGRRAADVELIINQIRNREWGLMLLDEVHVVPATMFRKVLNICNAHCKLGLTATLVREDDLISDLNFLIGPKLYEANWMDLTAGGYLANVQCVEAWCPMTAEFYREYLNESINHRKKELLYVTNPNKFRTCEFLVQYHQERGDKIILFADNVFALRRYSELLGIPYIYGGTREAERQRILGLFRLNTLVNCIGLSKVGDTSIDIPEANVIIQVSSHFGSRRQEAQRLGRILRPKANMGEGFNAFFYTLVSTGTSEMFFSAKRQQYLVDQGYTFKVHEPNLRVGVAVERESQLLPCLVEVVADLVEHANAMQNSKLKNKAAELDLLATVLNSDTDKADDEENEVLERTAVDAIDDMSLGRAKVQRRTGNMSELSGAGGARYVEFAANATDKVIARERQEKSKAALFKMRYSKKA